MDQVFINLVMTWGYPDISSFHAIVCASVFCVSIYLCCSCLRVCVCVCVFLVKVHLKLLLCDFSLSGSLFDVLVLSVLLSICFSLCRSRSLRAFLFDF